MAGAGFKDFADGNVLTGAELDTYLMQQSIMVFASEAARNTALAGVVANGMHAFTTDTSTLWRRVAGVWVGWESPETAFTPMWRSGSGGAEILIGNGTDTGWWRYRGGMIEFFAQRTRGSTTNLGASDHVLTLPKTSKVASGPNGSCTIQQSGGVVFPQTWLQLSTTELVVVGTPAGRINNTGYMKPDSTRNAWAAGQIIAINGTYPQA